MTVWPIILDSASESLRGRSLLLAPLGTDTLIGQLQSSLSPITPKTPLVLARAAAHGDQLTALREGCPAAAIVAGRQELFDAVAGCELSDALLIIDPRCWPAGQEDLADFARHAASDSRVAHQLVALETGISGTKEHVRMDAHGRVRGVLRYYEKATWPFIAGIAATFVSVSSGILDDDALPASLAELRGLLAMRGVSSRDVPITHGAFDLSIEPGLLAANEHFVLAASQERGLEDDQPILIGAGHSIDPSARIVGPVVIHAGARVGESATLIGPALIGAGVSVGAGAVVAHATLGAGSVVPAGAVIRDRVCADDLGEASATSQPSKRPSYSDRLVRVTVETREPARQAPLRPRRSGPKRILDATAAAVGLTLLSPFLMLVAFLNWLESRGPIFYAQEREGVGGHVFKCWKFRTMAVGADKAQKDLKAQDTMDGPHFKLTRDPRVTRVGRVLRALNVDELPQLFNVLVGDMSLVGPRPSPFRENQICVPWREARLSVRPGITGLWQVCRHDRSAGDFHQWIEYDLLYVQHASLWLDLKILIATVLTLGGKTPVRVSWLLGSTQRPVEATTSTRTAAEQAAAV